MKSAGRSVVAALRVAVGESGPDASETVNDLFNKFIDHDGELKLDEEGARAMS